MQIDTDELRTEIQALPAGPQREAAAAHLGAAEQHLGSAQTWITLAREQAARDAEAARLAAEQDG